MALTSTEANGRHRREQGRRRRLLCAKTDDLLDRVEGAIVDGGARRRPAKEVRDAIRHLGRELGPPWASEEDPLTNQAALDALHRLQWWPRPVRWLRLDEEIGGGEVEEEERVPGLMGRYPPNGERPRPPSRL